jgi:hypothetical protein
MTVTAPGREQTRYAHAVFWTRMADDGLLDPGLNLQWLIDTSTILASAETYLLITRLMGWDLDACSRPPELAWPGSRTRIPDHVSMRLTCCYDAQYLFWTRARHQCDVARITKRDSSETFP